MGGKGAPGGSSRWGVWGARQRLCLPMRHRGGRWFWPGVGAAISLLVTNFGAVVVLPWWDLRRVVASKLGAQGADVILLQMLLMASNPPQAVETHGRCSLFPETVSGKQRRGCVLAVQTPNPSAHAKCALL